MNKQEQLLKAWKKMEQNSIYGVLVMDDLNLKYEKDKADAVTKQAQKELKRLQRVLSKPQQIETGEWLYKGCFIQKSQHPNLMGKYSVFKNNKTQDNVGRCYTFSEAKKLCKANECFDNHLEF